MNSTPRWVVAGGISLIMLMGILVPPGWADPQDAQEKPSSSSTTQEAATSQATPELPAPPSSTTPVTTPGLISIDFKDAEIRQVLRIISLKSGVDIVAGTDVQGLVSIKLTNVPWEEALDILLRTYGYTYERKGTIIRVMTIAALEQEALATEVFPLDYATAKQVPDVIKEMLSERGKVKFDERTNTVIVTDIPTSLFQIKTVIERLDQRTPQVVIESKIVETKLLKNENLGINWSDSYTLAVNSATAPTTFPFPGGKNFGEIGTALIPKAGTFSPSDGASLPKGRIPERGGTFTFGTLDPTDLSYVFNFIASRTDTKILTNPTIAVLNNQEAKVHIGEEYPIPNYTIDPTTGRTSISGYTPKDIGTVLTVTPHVNPSSEIVVNLKPEIITAGTPITYNTGSGNSVSLPDFTIQTAETQVRIRDKQTIAIGGLVKTSDVSVEEKVPFLGDIPIVGYLFKNTQHYSGGSSDPVRQDLLIFLTVKLLNGTPAGEQAVASTTPEKKY